MLVVISLMSMIFSGLAVALHSMYRADGLARAEMESSADLVRLANRFRLDAHAAASAQAQEASLVLKIAGDESIAYEAGPKRVQRIVRSGDKVEHRDSFRLAKGAVVKWELPQEGAPKAVRPLVERAEGRASRIEARVGLDHRFERTPAP